jgi:MFS family permease
MAANPRRRHGSLPWDVRRLLASAFVNSLGNGFVLPFLFVYLHDERGLAFAVAGLVIASNGVAAIVVTPVAGAAIDRFGGRAVITVALVLSAIGYASYILVSSPWQAFLAAIVAGTGAGGYWPAHGTLLATASADRERAWGGRYQMMAAGFGVGVLLAGQVVHIHDAESFRALFLFDAATFLVCIGLVPRIATHSRERTGGGMLRVLSDRPFLFIFVLNTVLIAAGISQFDVLPGYLTSDAGLAPRAVSLVFVANTAAVALLQPAVAARITGRRRMLVVALAALVWASMWVLVLATGRTITGATAAALFITSGGVFGVGECLYAGTMGPIAADLAEPALLGRYMAVSSLSWSAGGVIGPAIGGWLLGRSGTLLWSVQALVLVAAATTALAGERLLPARARRSEPAAG